MAQRQGSLDRPFFPRRSTGSLLPDKAVGNFALCAAGLPGHRKTCTPCQHMHQCCPCLWQGASLQTGRKSPSFSPWEVVQAEAADGLDPISALREQRRAAVRAQAVLYLSLYHGIGRPLVTPVVTVVWSAEAGGTASRAASFVAA